MPQFGADDIHGSITALVTPFSENQLDEKTYADLIERQIKAGTEGLVPVGTTGESPTLTMDEHFRAIELCVEVAAGRVPVIAGAGSNSTHEALLLARKAEEAGADAILAVTGYYNKPSQEGVFQHYNTLHDGSGLPIIVYNVPGRTLTDVSADTMGRLSELPRIVGVKDATADLGRVAVARVSCGADFVQLSGEDITAVGFNAMGGRGCISVTSNVAPDLCAQMQKACREGNWSRAVEIQDRLVPLHLALFSDVNPAPVKYAMARLGLCKEDIRLPLVNASEIARQKVDAALKMLGLISD